METKHIIYLYVVALYFIGIVTASVIDVPECDPPNFPLYGGYGPVQDSYAPGDFIRYYCDSDTYIGGNFLRKCEDSGDWTGDTPVCDKSAELSVVNQTSTEIPEQENKAEFATDGIRSTCSLTKAGDGQSWMALFKHPGELIRVMVYMATDEIAYEVLLLKRNGQTLSCGKNTGRNDRLDWAFHNCPGPNNVDAIGFQIKSLSSNSLQICEVLSHVLTPPTCVDPHLSVDNGQIQLSRKVASLVCKDGYVKGHNNPVECIRNGVWNRRRLFCTECSCPNGKPKTKDGECMCIDEDEDCKNKQGCLPPGPLLPPLNVVLNPPDKPVTAVYSCPDGHVLKGTAVSTCLRNNTWSSKPPICLNVCEDPDIPIGGRVTYLLPRNAPGQRESLRWSQLSSSLTIREDHNSALEDGPLPRGFHKVGEIARFDCESKYYELVGSKNRRCQGKGEWSGRPPTCVPVCGRSDSPRLPLIMNGNVSDIGQWPWQAGISRYYDKFEKWFMSCGASLLNERWLITAAHCLTEKGTTNLIPLEKLRVYVGKYFRDDREDDEYVQKRTIREIHVHPEYDPTFFDADIGLIQLNERVPLSTRVRPVCLPTEQTSRENLVEGKRGVVTGWGRNENSSYSGTLMQAVLPFVSKTVCEKGYETWNITLTVTDNMFCAGYASGISMACLGDSGGPFVFMDESSKERTWVLEGLVSWTGSKSCSKPNQYGGYTAVSKFLDWIHHFI